MESHLQQIPASLFFSNLIFCFSQILGFDIKKIWVYKAFGILEKIQIAPAFQNGQHFEKLTFATERHCKLVGVLLYISLPFYNLNFRIIVKKITKND